MTIGDVSKKYDITIETLRYYERIELIPKIKRSKGGIREYSTYDCEWIYFVKCMRDSGMPIEALIKYVSLFNEGDSTRNIRKEMLIEQKTAIYKKMDALQEIADKLDRKIERYDQEMAQYEANLEKSVHVYG